MTEPKKSVIGKRGKQVKKAIGEVKKTDRAKELETNFLAHLNSYHLLKERNIPDLDLEILENEIKHINEPRKLDYNNNVTSFSPSSSDKCERELYFKATSAPADEQQMYAYQRRWVGNATAVHARVQKDLLYAERVLPYAQFKVDRLEDGTPAWESNIKNVKQFNHNDIDFQVSGMMDGILVYKDGSKIGFEFKTKSTTIATIGDYLMKDAQDSHKQQCIAYSLLFGVDEFLITYESLAKDGWMKGSEAKPDVRPIYFQVTDEDRTKLLDKFAEVAKQIKNKEIPNPDFDKCIFCHFKGVCQAVNVEARDKSGIDG